MPLSASQEPVLDKLGVRLIARNMEMESSTTVSALGGADIFGEADIFWYVPDGREDAQHESDEQFDLLQKQAILSGERMPILLTPQPANIVTDTSGRAWVGNIQPGATICPETTLENFVLVPPAIEACEFLQCSEEARAIGGCERYRSVCWIDRTDLPNLGKGQHSNFGYQDEGYPNFREHQWEGRKLSLLVLSALEEALGRWMTEVQEGRLPVADDMWHVGTIYEVRALAVCLRSRTIHLPFLFLIGTA